MPIIMKKISLIRLSVFLVIVLSALLVNGCAHTDSKTPATTGVFQVTEPRQAPTVSQVNPIDMAMDIPIDTTIEAVFTATMDPATLTTSTFTLQRETKQIPGSVTCSGTRVVFKPYENLSYSCGYTATINTMVKDTKGIPIARDRVWTFTTIKAPETITPTPNPAPEVVSVNPLNQTNNVPLNTTIEVVFSRQMDAATFTASTFILQKGTKLVSGLVTCSGTRAVFKPYEALSYSSVYTATIKTGVKDWVGISIIKDQVWTFTTIKAPEAISPTPTPNPAPDVVSVSPVNQTTGVPLNTTIEAVFSREMDPTTLTTSTFTLQQGTKTIPGSVTCSGTRVVLVPANALSYQSVYTAVITPGVKDLQGKSIAEDYKWSFTTVTAPISGGSSGGSVINSPTPTTSPTPSPTIKEITMYDSDLPAPPVSGMTFHFIPSAQGDPGPGKIRVSYLFQTYSIWFGVENHKLWVYHLPKRESLPASLAAFYDSLGITQYTTYTEEDGRYWFDGIPPWINIAKYDPNITTIPTLVELESFSGYTKIRYIAN
jgi:hypothetical protein